MVTTIKWSLVVSHILQLQSPKSPTRRTGPLGISRIPHFPGILSRNTRDLVLGPSPEASVGLVTHPRQSLVPRAVAW